MKAIPSITALAVLWLTCGSSQAALTIPGADGSDGALNITVSTNIDLGLAVTEAWDANNSANVGKGVYDPAKWAVVFKYSSVNIAAGVTVTFKNHPSRAPVVWLVNGSVTIDGAVNLNGAFGGYVESGTGPNEAGPGGFRGGIPSQPGIGYSAGFGPGAAYAGHGLYGEGQPRSYGNDKIIPLIGGSGGSGGPYRGGGGGGAILIAASGAISVSGTLSASGGTSYNWYGSGGAIRLIADQLLGSGAIVASGGIVGRIRLEGNTASDSLNVVPPNAGGITHARHALAFGNGSDGESGVRVGSIDPERTPSSFG